MTNEQARTYNWVDCNGVEWTEVDPPIIQLGQGPWADLTCCTCGGNKGIQISKYGVLLCADTECAGAGWNEPEPEEEASNKMDKPDKPSLYPFLRWLTAHGLEFHLDDDPTDIDWGGDPTPEQIEYVAEMHAWIWDHHTADQIWDAVGDLWMADGEFQDDSLATALSVTSWDSVIVMRSPDESEGA
jgi:hypothetical protein